MYSMGCESSHAAERAPTSSNIVAKSSVDEPNVARGRGKLATVVAAHASKLNTAPGEYGPKPGDSGACAKTVFIPKGSDHVDGRQPSAKHVLASQGTPELTNNEGECKNRASALVRKEVRRRGSIVTNAIEIPTVFKHELDELAPLQRALTLTKRVRSNSHDDALKKQQGQVKDLASLTVVALKRTESEPSPRPYSTVEVPREGNADDPGQRMGSPASGQANGSDEDLLSLALPEVERSKVAREEQLRRQVRVRRLAGESEADTIDTQLLIGQCNRMGCTQEALGEQSSSNKSPLDASEVQGLMLVRGVLLGDRFEKSPAVIAAAIAACARLLTHSVVTEFLEEWAIYLDIIGMAMAAIYIASAKDVVDGVRIVQDAATCIRLACKLGSEMPCEAQKATHPLLTSLRTYTCENVLRLSEWDVHTELIGALRAVLDGSLAVGDHTCVFLAVAMGGIEAILDCLRARYPSEPAAKLNKSSTPDDGFALLCLATLSLLAPQQPDAFLEELDLLARIERTYPAGHATQAAVSSLRAILHVQ